MRKNEVRIGERVRNKRRPFPIDTSTILPIPPITLTQTAALNLDLTFPSGTVTLAQLLTQTAPLNIDFTFPSGTLSYQLTQLYPLAIDFTFPSGAVLASSERSFQLFIDGVDRTKLIQLNTLQITNQISQASSANFELWDPTGTVPAPAVGQAVEIYHKNVLIFAGGIVQPNQTAFQGLAGHLFSGSGGGGGSAGTTGVSKATGSKGSGGVQCSDWSYLLTRRYVGAYYPSPAYLTVVVEDIVQTYLAQDGYTVQFPYADPGIDMGPLLLNWVTLQAAFNTISSATGWEFTVDYFKVIRFYPPGSGTGAAPFNIADNDGNSFAESLSIEYFVAQYRNKQGVISPTQSTALWSDIFSATDPGPIASSPQPPDGVRRAFFTLYALQTAPYVYVNGIPQNVIPITDVASHPVGWQWYWINPQGTLGGGPGVFQNPSNPPLQSTDILEVDYASNLSPIYWVQNDAQIAARALIEGNSGVYEDVQQAPSTMTDPNAIKVYAAGLLARYGANGIPFQVSYSTLRDGLFAGMLQNINIANPPIALSSGGLISEVVISDVDGDFLNYDVTVLQALYQGDWTTFFAALIASASVAQPGNFVTYPWSIAPSTPGIATPGIGNGDYASPYINIVQNAVELLQSMTVTVPDAYADGTLDVILFGPGHVGLITCGFIAGQAGTVINYPAVDAPVRMYRGETLNVEVFFNPGGAGVRITDIAVQVVTAVAVT